MVYKVTKDLYCGRIFKAGEVIQEGEYQSLDKYQKDLCSKIPSIDDMKKKPKVKETPEDDNLFEGTE